jgi:hypothetical protein
VITPMPGGPSPLPPSQTGVTPEESDMSATMDGGTLTFNSDALPNLSTVNEPVLVCTDPPDVHNAWRSTDTAPGGEIINFMPGQTDMKTRIMGQITNYRNRFDLPIASEQAYQDVSWEDVVFDHTAHIALQYNGNSIIYDSDDNISGVSIEPHGLAVDISGEGSVLGANANEQIVTRNGAEQIHITNNESSDTYESGGLSYTYDTTLFSDLATENDPPGPHPVTSSYDVLHGTNIFKQYVSPTPSGEWSQPVGAGSGTIKEDPSPTDRSVYVTVMLFGTNGYSCNTLQSSDPKDQNAGTIRGYAYGPPGASMTISFEVKLTLAITASDPNNPGVGGTPNSKITVEIWDAESGVTGVYAMQTSSGNPIPNGKILSANYAKRRGVHVTFDSSGKALVFTVTPVLENRGPGLVVFNAKAGIYWLGWLFGQDSIENESSLLNALANRQSTDSILEPINSSKATVANLFSAASHKPFLSLSPTGFPSQQHLNSLAAEYCGVFHKKASPSWLGTLDPLYVGIG